MFNICSRRRCNPNSFAYWIGSTNEKLQLNMIAIWLYVISYLSIFSVTTMALIFNTPPQCIVPPKICPNENITFFLYTSNSNKLEYEMRVDKTETILNAPFIKDAPIKFLIHGYTGHRDYAPNPQIRKAYFERREPVNIISLDYKNLVIEGCYINAVANSDLVANCTAQFLTSLLDQRPEIELERIHIVALSLGAQVSGQIRNYFHKGQFSRITGLDPAAPLFYTQLRDASRMLSSDDAKFVDVLHTNAGMRGKLWPIGHVDFYANLGVFQPGCGLDSSCSHERSVDYYAESINTKEGFWGYKCSDIITYILAQCPLSENSWSLYGEYCDEKSRGIYFFSTNRQPPYARGKQQDY